MASIFDSPSGVDIPDLRWNPSQNWGAGRSNMRQTEPRDYPGYKMRIPRPKRISDQDDIYEGAAEKFDWYRGGVTDELQVLPTEFAKELLEFRAVNGITPEKDQDTINAWNRFKKEQYQRRGKGGWQVPTEIGSDQPVSYPLSEWAKESTEFVNPRGIMAEARAMEEGGSAEGIPLTEERVDRRDFYTGEDLNWMDPNIHDKYQEQFPEGEDLGWMTEEERNKYLGQSVVKKPKVRGNY